MKKWMLTIVTMSLILLLAACADPVPVPAPANNGAQPEGTVLLEIISLDHSPIRPAVQDVRDVAAEFGDKVTVNSYNFGTPEGDAIAEERGLTDHTPIAIFINGEMTHEIGDRSIKFYSFPQDAGTGMVAEGIWTMDDLRTVLEQIAN